MSNKKVALITGANRGLGFETARQLGKMGIIIVVTARQLDVAHETAIKLVGDGIEVYAFQLDVTKADERSAVVDYLADKFGKLDILINNAGVAPKGPLYETIVEDTTPEEFSYIFETNFFSMVYLTKGLLPLLKKSESGRIVNLSSVLGSLSIHAKENSPNAGFRVLSYNTSKAAVNMFTIHLAAELEGTNIKVNSAHPGWVKTDMGGVDEAPMEITDGAKTSVELALIGEDGPSGQFIHLGEHIPW